MTLPAFSGVYVFGDSLVDPGNDLAAYNALKRLPVDLPNGAPTADKGYFEGRFTNGYNFADLVTNKLVFQASRTTFPYGVSNAFAGVSLPGVGRPDGNNLNFAYGGAAVGSAGDPAPRLGDQVETYTKGYDADPNAVYLVSIGANDVLHLVQTGGAPVTGADAQAQLASIAQGIANHVADLLADGARHVVVVNVPDVGLTPAYAGAVDEATRRALLSQYVQTVDAMLKADLEALALPQGATITQYDLRAYTDAVTANPAAYDISNATQAQIVAQPAVTDPTHGFLFFDKLHPTAQAHAQIASEVLGALAGTPTGWTAAPEIGAQVAGTVPFHGGETFVIGLTAGQSYVIDALGVSTASGTLADPLVRVLDGAGNLVAQADDGGVGLDAHLQFTAQASGIYTLEVRGVGVTDGSFRLQGENGDGGNLLLNGQLQGSNVSVEGGPANDTIAAVAGSNVLYGGEGGDFIVGGVGHDTINGNLGDDLIAGHSQLGDLVNGGQGNDWINLTQSTGHNLVNGNLGDDLVQGGAGGDSLRGGQGDDSIAGGIAGDWLSGDRGTNTLTGGGGADTFHAGLGVDLVNDFNLLEGDHVAVDAGVTWTVSQSDQGAVLDLSSGGRMVLAGVQSTSLTGGWILAG